VTLVDPHLRTLQQKISSELAGLSSGQLTWHPPEKWSAAEILEHLYLTYTGTIKGFGRMLAADRPLGSTPTWKNRAQAFVVVQLGYLPTGREAPSTSRPKGLPPEKVASEIVSKIAEMDEILRQCAMKFGPRAKVLDHPFLGPFSINQWRKFHLVHGLHHVRQIQRLGAEMKRSDVTTP
jgi:hypothetical protein